MKKEQYVPNSLTRTHRVFNVLLILALITYGGYGIYFEELYLPLDEDAELTLYGTSIYIACTAFGFGCLILLAQIIDHYDKRDNEQKYDRFIAVCRSFGLMTLLAAIIGNLAN
ncbi:hypothetical protein CWB85_02755 [Pseudoalteromonas sp. S1727]|uniref:hypothetical protein n=1 Tax=Pseudoalteromonas sp. S1727 TaxID=2066514 RepID=UPI001108CFB0|nr:hypothetical protein [Pseudoalteromonas sp. S1727]TMN73604.1 hypothetical protein CWB85_02755 [Pseudoalteromonas sp. S1727]